MIVLGRPTDNDLDRLAAQAAGSAPTFQPGARSDYRTDEWSRPLRSTTTWDEAKDALGHWRAHRGAGVRVRPSEPPHPGQTVALAVPLGAASVLAPCRVTGTVDTDDAAGFTYATLPGHPEEGEEAFALRLGADGAITFHITAVSRPADLLTRLGGPVSRALQRRVTHRYLRLDGLGAEATRG